MNIALLSFPFGQWNESYEEGRLLEEAKKRGLTIDLVVSRDGTEALDLKNYDAILARVNIMDELETRLNILKELELKKTPVLNNYSAIFAAKSKILTYEILKKYEIQQPQTFVLTKSEELSEAAKKVNGYPLILKDPCGSYGHGVILAESERSARSIVDRLLEPWGELKEVLIQEFVEEAHNADLRLFVIQGKVVASMKRTAQNGEFRSNAELGGACTVMEPSLEQVKAALNAVKALGLDVAGVDLLEAKSGPLVIEVNANPGFKALEKATGVNVAGLMVEALMEKSLQSC